MNDVDESTERRIRVGQTIRIVVWVAAIGILIAFGALNTEQVEVDWIVTETTARLWVVIAASALLGALVGVVAARQRK